MCALITARWKVILQGVSNATKNRLSLTICFHLHLYIYIWYTITRLALPCLLVALKIKKKTFPLWLYMVFSLHVKEIIELISVVKDRLLRSSKQRECLCFLFSLVMLEYKINNFFWVVNNNLMKKWRIAVIFFSLK